jgi:hypothetical protein
MVQMTEMRALPCKLGWRRRVSLESRYGMCPTLSSVSLAMTVPNVKRDLLMYAPSRRLSADEAAFSEPARSIRF